MANFDFKTWYKNSDLKEATVESLQTEDLDTEDALKLLQGNDLEKLGLTGGQKQGLEAALRKLKHETKVEGKLSDMTGSEPVTTKSLAKMVASMKY